MAETVQQALRERLADDTVAVKYGDRTWTWHEHLGEASAEAAALLGLFDGFGSTETAVIITREPGMPAGSVGRGAEGVAIYNSATVTECAPARFDEHGALVNADEAVGELVNTQAPAISRATTTTSTRTESGFGMGCTGRAIWPTGSRTAGSTSPAGPRTGCGWTARTSPPRRSSGS